MFIKNNRKRNQDGTFKKDVGWTPWNEAWSYKMSDSLKDMLNKTLWKFVEAFIGSLVGNRRVGVDANAVKQEAISGDGSELGVVQEYANKQVNK